jgi:hypothetical protein
MVPSKRAVDSWADNRDARLTPNINAIVEQRIFYLQYGADAAVRPGKTRIVPDVHLLRIANQFPPVFWANSYILPFACGNKGTDTDDGGGRNSETAIPTMLSFASYHHFRLFG